jgi:LAO/AO transport system kinase
VVRDLRNMIALAGRPADGAKRWKPPIIPTVAVNGPRDEGICDLVAKLDAHWKWLTSTGELNARRRARARDEITVLAVAALHARLDLRGLDALAGQVADGTLDPFTAAETLLEGIRLPRG